MKPTLTTTQWEILEFLRAEAGQGRSPSYRQIASAVGLSSVSSIGGHLDRLERAGLVSRSSGPDRAITVLDLPWVLEIDPNTYADLDKYAKVKGLSPGDAALLILRAAAYEGDCSRPTPDCSVSCETSIDLAFDPFARPSLSQATPLSDTGAAASGNRVIPQERGNGRGRASTHDIPSSAAPSHAGGPA